MRRNHRWTRLLAVCLCLAALLAVPASAVDYQEGVDNQTYSGWKTQQFGNNYLTLGISDTRVEYRNDGDRYYDGRTLEVTGVLMIDGLEAVRVTCGGVSQTVAASSGREFSVSLTLTHSGSSAAEVATRRSGETAFRNVTHGQFLFQQTSTGYEFAMADSSVETYDYRGAANMIGTNDPEPANQLAQPVPASVAAMSAQIVGDETSTYDKMFLLYKWVVDNIAHDTAMESGAAAAVTDSESVLTLRRSNSTGYANLLRDLLLAQRIPAMTCETEYLPSGSYATAGVRGVRHSHVEAYISAEDSALYERWIFMDPATDSLNTYTGGTLHTESANGYNTFDLVPGAGMISLTYKYIDRSGLLHIDNGDGFVLGGANFTEVWEYNGPGGEVTIPAGVTWINEGAFAGRTDITAVHIPEGVEMIWNGAFRGCTGLKEITLPASLEGVSSYAFAGCTGLERVNLSQVNSRTTIGDHAFAGCTSLRSIYIPHMYTFGRYAFAGSGIRVLQFADDYRFAMYNTRYSFSDIPYLTAVELPGSGTFDRIEDYVFYKDGRVLDEPLQIYYKGTGDEWDNLNIDVGNELIWDARWHYNSAIPEDVLAEILSEELPPVEGLSLLPGYPDVSEWAQEDVTAAAELLQLAEVPFLQDTFDYTEDITRADFAALAVQAYEVLTGEEVPYAPEDAVFADSAGDEAMAKAYTLGIVTGYNEGASRAEISVQPGAAITREQAAAMLVRVCDAMDDPMPEADAGDLPFTDYIRPWAQESVARAYAAGVMNGTGESTFSGSGSYTIEQAIVTMYRAAQ